MIGKIKVGGSFAKCLDYCLSDKKELSAEEKLELSMKEGVQHINRAEILMYNNCSGDKYDLMEQFNDVRKLNRRVEKPVFHMTIRQAPGDHLTRGQWMEVSQAVAREFGIDKNQFITILHHDTKQEHIHMIGNRVGYDGKVASDSHSYAKTAKVCRELEKEHNLHKVLNPRRWLSPKERKIPRSDKRKELLQEEIQKALKVTKTFPEFEKTLSEKGYSIEKGRGITFEDEKKVRVKGSEVGYSLKTIETTLAKNAKREQKKSLEQEQEKDNRQRLHISRGLYL